MLFGFVSYLSAVPIFWGPTPYLSKADIPVGFYAGGGPTVLEDFENNSLHPTITALDAGGILPISAYLIKLTR